jgi:hypothetical protein
MVVKKEVSFLPEEENVNSFSSRAIKWVTTVGRFVIVFTELIVICAFLSRFWLDRTNSDLSEVVRQQRAILESTTEFEKDYSLLQKRLKIIKTFYQNQPEYQAKVVSLVESTPDDISYNRLVLKHDPLSNLVTAEISLTAYQESSVVNFVTNLMVNTNISSVDIKTIEKKPRDSKYSVDLALIFTKDKP